MARFSLLTASLFALRVVAQGFASVDSKSGISFQTYQDSKTSVQFGVALPDTPDKDFIGQIVAPVTDEAGWAGLDMGSTMSGRLIIVAWPYSGKIISSFRKASGYVTPPVYANSSMSLSTIEDGTYVNATHFSYTFLCSGCITGDLLSFASDTANGVFGWAYSKTAVLDPSSVDSALSYHSDGFGAFGLNLTNARAADYATWAASAVASTLNSVNVTTATGALGSALGLNGTTSSTTVTGSEKANTTATVSNSTYDYIIAGGGPAGIIAAERIAESGASVLLIERGAASTYASGGKSVVSWNDTVTQYDVPAYGYYLTTMADSSEYCADTASMAGCILGGGTMVNALMFVRPQEADFDDKWPTGWKWADVSPSADQFYKRNPGTLNPSADGKRYDQGAYDVLSTFLSGNGWSSVDALAEPNKKQDVFSHPPWNIQDGLRAGPVMTYLPQAQALPNFKLSLNTKVIRAIRTGSAVTGVEVETSTGARQIINIKDGGKVILASGALSTPRILFNSGIGPAAQIKTVQSGSVAVTLPEEADWINLPVGEGLKDHPIVTLKFKTSTPLKSLTSADFTDPSTENTDLFAHGQGVLAQAGQRLNFWTSVNGSDGASRYVQGTCNSPADDTIQMKVYLTHGLTSTGTLGITSAGATEFTTTPWLNTDGDKNALASFIDRMLALSRKSNSTLSYTGESTATGADLLSGYVSGSHFVGTAKMGSDDGRDSGTSVVDLNTKVYGTDNLFVVDASMHPDLPTGNTQAMVMVAAEAAAAKILALGSGSSTAASSAAASSAPSATVAASKAATSTIATQVAAVTSSAAASSVASSAGPVVSAASSAAPIVPASSAAPVASSAALSTAASSGFVTATRTSSGAAASATAAKKYGQCGGSNWTGPTACEEGSKCTAQNPYYSQCV